MRTKLRLQIAVCDEFTNTNIISNVVMSGTQRKA